MALVIESGSRTIMRMTTPPTGWTKDTSFNDYALRVTTGSVVNRTTGESFSTVFKNYTNISVSGPITYSVGATTITSTTMVSHAHIGRTAPTPALPTLQLGRRSGSPGTFANVPGLATAAGASAVNINSPVSGGASHTHSIGTLALTGSIQLSGSPVSINLAVKYVDTIIAIRN